MPVQNPSISVAIFKCEIGIRVVGRHSAAKTYVSADQKSEEARHEYIAELVEPSCRGLPHLPLHFAARMPQFPESEDEEGLFEGCGTGGRDD